MAETIHSQYGPSAAHRWLYCPGSIKAESEMPEEPESPYAAEGHAAHALAENMLKNNAVVCEDKEMIEYVTTYVNYVRSIGGKQEYEQLVDYSEWIPGGFGTADAIAIVGDILHVIDLKYGKGVPVNAVDNPQGVLYALGALLEREMLQRFSKVVIHIVQPRLNNISTWEVTPDYVYDFAAWAKEQWEATQREYPERIAGEKQCRWCKAKSTCHALATLTENAIQMQFEDLTLQNARPTPPENLRDEDIRFILNQKPLIINWLNSVEEHVRKKLESGEPFSGFKLVHGRATRKWTDEAEAEKKLVKLLGKKEAYTQKLLSVAQAEKALGKENKDKIQDLITKPDGALTLVPDTDPREPVSLLTVNDFNFN